MYRSTLGSTTMVLPASARIARSSVSGHTTLAPVTFSLFELIRISAPMGACNSPFARSSTVLRTCTRMNRRLFS
jgi:hypothetical protein